MRVLVLRIWARHRRRKPDCNICAFLSSKGYNLGEPVPAYSPDYNMIEFADGVERVWVCEECKTAWKNGWERCMSCGNRTVVPIKAESSA